MTMPYFYKNHSGRLYRVTTADHYYDNLGITLMRYSPWPQEAYKTQDLLHTMPRLVQNYYVDAIERTETAHPDDDELVRAAAYAILVGKALDDASISQHVKEFLHASATLLMPVKTQRVDVRLRYLFDEFYSTLNAMADEVLNNHDPDGDGSEFVPI